MNGHLAIIPCTKSKIWDFLPQIGEVPATCAYTGPEFVLSKQLMTCADRIIIFSAKYGFLDPWERIPETYDITFSRADDQVISTDTLKQQASNKGLVNFKYVTTTCNQHYQKRIIDVFSPTGITVRSPVKNLVDEEEICMKINGLIDKKTDWAEYVVIN